MTPEDRDELASILADLRGEETDQEAQQVFASTRVSRSVASLSLLRDEGRASSAEDVA